MNGITCSILHYLLHKHHNSTYIHQHFTAETLLLKIVYILYAEVQVVHAVQIFNHRHAYLLLEHREQHCEHTSSNTVYGVLL